MVHALVVALPARCLRCEGVDGQTCPAGNRGDCPYCGCKTCGKLLDLISEAGLAVSKVPRITWEKTVISPTDTVWIAFLHNCKWKLAIYHTNNERGSCWRTYVGHGGGKYRPSKSTSFDGCVAEVCAKLRELGIEFIGGETK